MVCKVLLQERQCLVAADGKAGMLALKTDVQVSRPLGVIAAAAQTDAYNGEFFAVNAYLLVGNANAEGVSPGTVCEIRVCLKILKADLVKKVLEVCRSLFVSCRVGHITRCKAHRHRGRCKILTVIIRGIGKIRVAVSERAGVVRLHVVMSGIEHDCAGHCFIIVVRRQCRQRHERYDHQQRQRDANEFFHSSSSNYFIYLLCFHFPPQAARK